MQVSFPVLTVSKLVALLREALEDNFVQVLVQGELSNFSAPASGHYYFSLKDQKAQLRAVMFRSQNRLLDFRPERGMQVICFGRVSMYEARGEVQLVVESLEPKGVGGLQVAFEQLKARLAEEGLFAAERKRALPLFPRCIGVVTSASGAAIHDILNVLRRRGVGARILLRPVRVQGEGAGAEIAEAVADLNRHAQADVLIVGRGGGSLEDLWAFNEEIVARAIHASKIPVISAVGHETDVTIADFVADLRAPTPSAAAEMVAKGRLELEGHLDQLTLRLCSLMRGRLQVLGERVGGLRQRLRSPLQRVDQQGRRLDELEQRLQRAMSRRLRSGDEALAALAARLEALSPLKVLGRGYAIAFHAESDEIVREAASVRADENLRLKLARGELLVKVTEVKP